MIENAPASGPDAEAPPDTQAPEKEAPVAPDKTPSDGPPPL